MSCTRTAPGAGLLVSLPLACAWYWRKQCAPLVSIRTKSLVKYAPFIDLYRERRERESGARGMMCGCAFFCARTRAKVGAGTCAPGRTSGRYPSYRLQLYHFKL